MLFSHRQQNHTLREARLIFVGEVPQQARIEQMVKRAQEVANEFSTDILTHVEGLAQARIEAAGKDGAARREHVQKVVTNLATALSAAGAAPDRLTTVFSGIATVRAPGGTFQGVDLIPAGNALTEAQTKRIDSIINASAGTTEEREIIRPQLMEMARSLPPNARQAFLDAAQSVVSSAPQLSGLQMLAPRLNTFMTANPTQVAGLRTLTQQQLENPTTQIPEGPLRAFVVGPPTLSPTERTVLLRIAPFLVAADQAGSELLSDRERVEIETNARGILREYNPTGKTGKELESHGNIIIGRLMMAGCTNDSAVLGIPKRPGGDPSKIKAMDGKPLERTFNKFMGLVTIFLAGFDMAKGKFDQATGATSTTPEAAKEAREGMQKRMAALNENPLNTYARLRAVPVDNRTDIEVKPPAGVVMNAQVIAALQPLGGVTGPNAEGVLMFADATGERFQALETALQGVINAGAEGVAKEIVQRIASNPDNFNDQDRKAITEAVRTQRTWVRATGGRHGDYDYIAAGDRVFMQKADGTRCWESNTTTGGLQERPDQFFNSVSGQLEARPPADRAPRYNATTRVWEASTDEQIKKSAEETEKQSNERQKRGTSFLAGIPTTVEGAMRVWDAPWDTNDVNFRFHNGVWQFQEEDEGAGDDKWHSVDTSDPAVVKYMNGYWSTGSTARVQLEPILNSLRRINRNDYNWVS